MDYIGAFQASLAYRVRLSQNNKRTKNTARHGAHKADLLEAEVS